MLNLLQRSIAALDRRLVLLAPPATYAPPSFHNVDVDFDRHGHFVREVQRFRGRIYVDDGALQWHQLSADGLHCTPEDEKSWHLLMLNARGGLSACAWYREHSNRVYFDRLRLRHCPLARSPEWRDKLWKAVESEIASARRDGLRYAEVGGWAVATEGRRLCEGVVLALAAYGLAGILGDVLGITTATARHGSAGILKGIGGRHLEVDGVTVPPYYDAGYRCDMEILRFDSRQPDNRFSSAVEMLRHKLSDVAVVARPCWPAMLPWGCEQATATSVA
jgi:hypothetical protein